VDRILLLEMEDLQRHLAEQGRELQFLSPHIFHLRSPARHLERIVKENVSAAWILHFAGHAAQRWFDQQGIPAFIYGSPFPRVNLPFIVNDWETAAFHAGLQLVRHGHRVIGVFSLPDQPPGVLAVMQGVRRALATVTPPAQLVVFKGNHTPETIVHSLETVFETRPRPTALVFTGSNQLLTSLSWMVSRRIGVPADISLICIPSDTWFQDLNPPICHYENNSALFAQYLRNRVMDLVETGRIARKSILVPLEFKQGASIGPPPPAVAQI